MITERLYKGRNFMFREERKLRNMSLYVLLADVFALVFSLLCDRMFISFHLISSDLISSEVSAL